MKKVLALVLAVVMVCTMAMAVDAAVTVQPSSGSNDKFGSIKLATAYDPTVNYVLELDDEFFKVLDTYLVGSGKTADRDAKNFKVEGVNGAFSGGKFQIPVDSTDRALDGKVDMTISTLRISSVKKTKTYAEFTAKDGKLDLSKLVLGGVSQPVTGVFTKDFWAAYDIGYETIKLTTGTSFTWTTGWYLTGDKAIEATDISNKVTLKVPANTAFKLTVADGDPAKISASVIPTGVNINKVSVDVNGYKVTAGSLTYKVLGDTNDYYYGVDKDGKLFASGLSFGVTKDINGVETGYWTMTTTDARNMVKADGVIPNVGGATTTPGSTGSTTNPGTGANDVVGVAAALAVVALVSGAAISLKK